MNDKIFSSHLFTCERKDFNSLANTNNQLNTTIYSPTHSSIYQIIGKNKQSQGHTFTQMHRYINTYSPVTHTHLYIQRNATLHTNIQSPTYTHTEKYSNEHTHLLYFSHKRN